MNIWLYLLALPLGLFVSNLLDEISNRHSSQKKWSTPSKLCIVKSPFSGTFDSNAPERPSIPIFVPFWRQAFQFWRKFEGSLDAMFGTAPNPDDVSVLLNGAMENSEYDLRKQMNRRTSHKMNLNTDFQTWFTISLLWCEIYIEGPIKNYFFKVYSEKKDLLSWIEL